MKRTVHTSLCLFIIALCMAPISAEAQGNWKAGDSGSMRFRLGMFEPDADSEYWHDVNRDFTGDAADFEDLTVAVDYLWQTGRSSGLLFTLGFFEGDSNRSYLDWLDAGGYEVRHTATLETVELAAAWTIRLGGSRTGANPYVGVGAGMLWWNLEEAGWFIDFADSELPVVRARYQAEGSTLEWFLLAGVEIPIGDRWSFLIEGRWRNADDTLGDDLAGLGSLDLSGLEVSAGFGWRF